MALIFFRLWRKLVKMKVSFPWKLQNRFFLHIHFKTTSLLTTTLEKEMATHSSSRLENPRDGGARWATVYGIAPSWTRRKRLSNSSSSLLKGLPREKLVVNPFHVLECHCPLCLRPDSVLGKSELQAKQRNKQKKQVKDVLNLRQETMKSLSVCLDLFMSQDAFFFIYI